MKAANNKDEALIVTTAHKGVFFGYGQATTDPIIEINNARMCVSWSAEVKGVVGLAADGPIKGCRITAAAPSIILRDVTAIMRVSEKAVRNWENCPWT